MNTEERQLAEMLHRVTPEPPRRVTVEDVASRLASEPQRGAAPRRPGAAPRRGSPAGAAAGRRCWPRSACSPSPGPARASRPWRPRTTATAPHAGAARRRPRCRRLAVLDRAVAVDAGPGAPRIAGGIWGAELINRQSFSQDSLTGSGDSLYAFSGGSLDRIDPATGDIVQTTPYSPPVPSRPVVMGNTVWVVWSYGGGDVVLRGYDARTLAQVASVPVPAIGGVSSAAQGVLAAGPDGQLYLAAGDTVATVDPASPPGDSGST